jgi:hypothetical protein
MIPHATKKLFQQDTWDCLLINNQKEDDLLHPKYDFKKHVGSVNFHVIPINNNSEREWFHTLQKNCFNKIPEIVC